jgi:hypothetical protein
MRSSGHQLAPSWFKARLALTTPTSPKPGRNLQSVLDELGKALANRTLTGGTLPLFEARVGAGNPLATPIPGLPDKVPPTLRPVAPNRSTSHSWPRVLAPPDKRDGQGPA